MSPLDVTVIVPTYARPERLAACLEGLRAQTRPAEDVVVIVHVSDEISEHVVERWASDWPELRRADVERHGLVAALNRGLASARGELVAFVDDDAVPAADWLERIVTTFQTDERIAAVGGRDIVIVEGRTLGPPRRGRIRRGAEAPDVGRIQWFGRMIANHHLGVGQARDVDLLKGANMSFRAATVAGHGFDERLLGRGSQVHSELSICLPLRRQRLRVVYDPNIIVHHYPAPRPHGDHRESAEQMFAASHNESLQILDHFGPIRRVVFMAWGAAVGTTAAPGLAVATRDFVNGRPGGWDRLAAAQRGRMAAWQTRRIPRFDGGNRQPKPLA
jgi:GT2 family glycosyltransferase